MAGRLDEVSLGTSRALLCAYVKHSTLNSATEQKLRYRRVDARANATTLFSGESVIVNHTIRKFGLFFVFQYWARPGGW